jgi:hypothetical protein
VPEGNVLMKKATKKKKPLTMNDLAERIGLEEKERRRDVLYLEKVVTKSLEGQMDAVYSKMALATGRLDKLEHSVEMSQRWISANEKLFSDTRKKLGAVYSSLSSIFN